MSMTPDDRAWLSTLADSLDKAARYPGLAQESAAITTIRLSDTFARAVADRLRDIVTREAIATP